MDLPNGDPEDPRQGLDNPDRRASMRQQLVLLLHAYKCMRRYHVVECTLQHCATMRRVLIHLETCRKVATCTEAHCASSRQILNHWTNCTNDNCQLCLPLRISRIKEWQHSMTEAQRGHLVDLMLESCPLRAYLVSHFTHLEQKIYDRADSLEDYYREMAVSRGLNSLIGNY